MDIEVITEGGSLRESPVAVEMELRVGGETTATGIEGVIQGLIATGRWRPYSGVCHCGADYSGAIRQDRLDPTECARHLDA